MKTKPKEADGMVTLRAYVVFDKAGIQRTTKGVPGLAYGEHACELSITVPKALFQRPTLSAAIKFEGPVTQHFSTELVDSVDRVLTDAGFSVRVESVDEPTPKRATAHGD